MKTEHKYDALFAFAMLMHFSVAFMTKFVLVDVAGTEGLGEVAVELEANPIMRLLFDFKYAAMLASFMAVAFLTGVYLHIRHNYVKARSDYNKMMLQYYTVALFMVFAQNLLNDASYFLSIIWS